MIERFELSKHADKVAGWHFDRGDTVQANIVGNPESFPPIGMVGESMAVWCYMTGGPQMFLEHVISRPSASREEKREEFSEMVSLLCLMGKEMGAKSLVMFTPVDERGIVERMSKYGFTDLNPKARYAQLVKAV